MRPNTSLSPRQFVLALIMVASGGAFGTLLRDLLSKIDDHQRQFTGWTGYAPLQLQKSWIYYVPWVLLTINFVGVFVATRLLRGRLRGHDPNDPIRLLLITGFFGGLTSYSGLFVDLSVLWHYSIAGCLSVAAGAILSGVFAAWLGLLRFAR